jgi:hypothetical protein
LKEGEENGLLRSLLRSQKAPDVLTKKRRMWSALEKRSSSLRKRRGTGAENVSHVLHTLLK